MVRVAIHNLKLNPIIIKCLFHSKLLQILIPFKAINPLLRIESKEINKNAKIELQRYSHEWNLWLKTFRNNLYGHDFLKAEVYLIIWEDFNNILSG